MSAPTVEVMPPRTAQSDGDVAASWALRYFGVVSSDIAECPAWAGRPVVLAGASISRSAVPAQAVPARSSRYQDGTSRHDDQDDAMGYALLETLRTAA